MLNNKVVEDLRANGITNLYVPHLELPVGTEKTSSQILSANLCAIEKSNVVLAILDRPGLGVAVELTWALAKQKRIAAFRSVRCDFLGHMLEGLWSMLPEDCKTVALDSIPECVRAAAKSKAIAL